MFRSVNIFSILMLAAVVAPLVRATNNTTNSTERKYPKQGETIISISCPAVSPAMGSFLECKLQ
ncbi:hypothetical protein OUZ56_002998 [Daphnia magna]|uniref:Uncharacterized protein n=1 Tax=Daphnia magna TaxID=35525 RepID=A0ABR0A7E2_9CRUS|nr:hypothetical protein OUZ56_002998 [Daphnia magna]